MVEIPTPTQYFIMDHRSLLAVVESSSIFLSEPSVELSLPVTPAWLSCQLLLPYKNIFYMRAFLDTRVIVEAYILVYLLKYD